MTSGYDFEGTFLSHLGSVHSGEFILFDNMGGRNIYSLEIEHFNFLYYTEIAYLRYGFISKLAFFFIRISLCNTGVLKITRPRLAGKSQ